LLFEHLDYYTVIVFLSLVSLFITSGFYIPLSIYEKYFSKKEKNINLLPEVTIIVPAFNEETGISRTLDSILEADYPHKEVIVVDDG
jgi:cellulose synthase/poly-beta-1,6-N-acetylglucosamine synthase-like glycosyltransferase